MAADRQKKKEGKSKEDDRSSKHHSGSSRSSRHSPHSSHRSRSPTYRSSRHRHDDHHRSSRHRDRYGRNRSLSPPYISHELEYQSRLREYDRLRMPPPPFRDPFFDPLGPPPRDPFARPRDDPYFMDRFGLPPLPPLPPPGRMRDPYGPLIPDPYRIGPPPPIPHDREPLNPVPPRPLTPPVAPERKRDSPMEVVRDMLRDRGPLRERSGQSEKIMDMEIIVVNRQQK
jgi:hypothetical protein